MSSKQKDPEAQRRKEAIKRADIRLLAQLGYKQEFKRAFKPLEVFGISFSIIGLLPSIASVLYYSLPNGGGPAMVWRWLVASLFILCIGMSMGELASAAPTSGGVSTIRSYMSLLLSVHVLFPSLEEVDMLDCRLGKHYREYSSRCFYRLGLRVQVMAAVAISTDGEFSASNAQIFGVYAAIIVTHSIVCCLGTTILARLQTVYIILNIVLCMVVIIVLPITTPEEFRNTPAFALTEFTNFNGWPSGFAFIYSFLAPLWTICSFDYSVHISEESSNAAVSVPWIMVNAIAVSGILGWAINMVLAFCMGCDLEGLWNSDQPMATIFLNSFGKPATLAIWIVLVLVQNMMGTSMLLGASRQTFAFSRDGALPFSGWLYKINDRTNTPINSVWYDAFFALALGLLAFAGEQAIGAAFALSVTALYVAYAIPIAARFLGDNDFEPGPFHLGRFVHRYLAPCAFISVVFMGVMTIVFLFPETPSPTLADMNHTVAVLFGVLALSMVWYYFPTYGGVYWFNGLSKQSEMQSNLILDQHTRKLSTSRYKNPVLASSRAKE